MRGGVRKHSSLFTFQFYFAKIICPKKRKDCCIIMQQQGLQKIRFRIVLETNYRNTRN
jgi:hypothetical protein